MPGFQEIPGSQVRFPLLPSSVLGSSLVGVTTVDGEINVVGLLTKPVTPPVPRPRYNTIDRPGSVGITEYAGMDPYQMTMSLRFDGGGVRSVEKQYAALEALAYPAAGTLEPPVLRIRGPVPHPLARWRINQLTVDDSQTMLLKNGDRCRIAVDVDLLQYVVDDLLLPSLKATKRAKGINSRATRVKSGEDTLFDVSRRLFGDPSHATDIARASHLRLGARLKPGQMLLY
jgi:hypothetical protein